MPHFIKSILVLSLVYYIVLYITGRKTYKKKLIKVPKIISIILGNPVKIGVVTAANLLGNIGICISLIVGIISYYITDIKSAAMLYIGTFLICEIIFTAVLYFIEKDI